MLLARHITPFVLFALVGITTAANSAALRILGSTTVNPVVAEAASMLRAEQGLEIVVDTAGGSSGGIAALASGRADIGMSSRPLSDTDRQRYPGTLFHATRIGIDAVALAVSKDVWEGGVRSLTKQQVRDLYEGRIDNWRQLGGPDRRVVFFNKEPGRGTWEVFVRWLYGKPELAPLVSLREVGSNEEARSKAAGTPGAATQLSAAWVDGKNLFALSLEGSSGRPVAPGKEQLADGSYPLARPLLLVTQGLPTGDAMRFVHFVLGPRGQELVQRHGYLPLAGPSPTETAP